MLRVGREREGVGRIVIYFGCAWLWPVGAVPLFPRIQIKGKTVPMKALGEVLHVDFSSCTRLELRGPRELKSFSGSGSPSDTKTFLSLSLLPPS